MTAAATRQFLNASTATGPATWSVVGKWTAGESVRTIYSNLTYRMAKAMARSMRNACGYANVVRTEA